MAETTSVIAPPGTPTIVITRIFDAPRRLVWEAATRPELVRRWWGPCNSEMLTCEMDFRVGGAWRNVLRMPHDGSVHGFHGVYREIVPHERIVQTFIYEPFPTNEAIETCELVEHGGITKMTITIRHSSVEMRDGHLASGMERGLGETHARLDAVLAELVNIRSAS